MPDFDPARRARRLDFGLASGCFGARGFDRDAHLSDLFARRRDAGICARNRCARAAQFRLRRTDFGARLTHSGFGSANIAAGLAHFGARRVQFGLCIGQSRVIGLELFARNGALFEQFGGAIPFVFGKFQVSPRRFDFGLCLRQPFARLNNERARIFDFAARFG